MKPFSIYLLVNLSRYKLLKICNAQRQSIFITNHDLNFDCISSNLILPSIAFRIKDEEKCEVENRPLHILRN